MKKSINIFWSIALIIVGISSIILAGSQIIGIELPSPLIVTLGIIDLASIAVLSFTTIKKVQESKTK